MIEHVSLDHGWYYFYRVHKERLNQLPSHFSNLRKYLLEMLTDCPDSHFKEGPRSSKLKLDVGIEPREVPMHPVSRFAEEGLDWGHYKTRHSNVQVYMLNNDPQTLAVETPLWMEQAESGFDMFDAPLSGHIDLLRWEGDKLWVWDYKPNASAEKHATTQTYFYALMLSLRTQIPMERFMCGYFDRETSFVFDPQRVDLNKSLV